MGPRDHRTENQTADLPEGISGGTPRKKGAMAYTRGAHTTARVSRDLYKKAKSYAAEHGTSISKVLEEAIKEYIEEARERLRQGKPLDLPLRSNLPRETTYIVSWHGDPDLTKQLRSIAAQDGVNIRTALTLALERKLAGWEPSALKGEGEAGAEPLRAPGEGADESPRPLPDQVAES